MSLKERFKSASTIREHEEEIEGLGLCLFIEPSYGESSEARKKFMKYTAEGDEEGKVKMVMDNENSDIESNNYASISMTLHDPITRERVFADGEEARKVLNERDSEGKPLHGSLLINKLIAGANKVTTELKEKEVEKN